MQPGVTDVNKLLSPFAFVLAALLLGLPVKPWRLGPRTWMAVLALGLSLFPSMAAAQSLTVSNLASTSATVTISSHTGDWFYDISGGTNIDCTNANISGSSVNLTGLTPNSDHTFSAWTSCSGPPTVRYLAEVGFTTLAASPTLTASSVEATTATLTITNHTGAWYYKYTVPETPAGSCSSMVAGGTATASLTDLTAGTSYTFKAYSDSTCATELTGDATDAEFTTKPAQVTGVTVTGYHQRVEVNWTATTGATGYTVQWKSGNQSFGTDRQATTTNNYYSITGLISGTVYTVQVKATNGTGDGAWSNAATGTANTATLSASSVQTTAATLTLLNWPKDWYYKHTTPPNGTCSTTATMGVFANLTGLTAGTSYTYKAYSDSTCATEVTSATTDAEFLTKPAQVTGVAVSPGDASLGVSWTALSGTVTGYKVQWKSGQQNYNTGDRQKTVTSGTTTTITGLTNATTYTVRVTAYNNTGDGTASTEVTGTPAAPTLTASNVKETTATLTISNHTDAWYYKYTVPATPAGSCSSVVAGGTTTASLTGLTGGTAYTYKAYSNNTCTTEITSASTDAEFSTVGLTANPVAQTTATLTLANWSAAWWHNKTAGPGSASCTSVAANTTTASLTGLTVNSNYTWTVYSASGCASANKIADVAFSTSAVSLAASAVTETTATLTLTGTTAAWWYQRIAPTGDDTCHSVSANDATDDLTGLTGGTAYTYKAYSENTCATEITNDSTDAEFSTVGLTANPVAQTTATLTLANWSAAWWHNKTTGPGSASCTSVAANTTTASLSSLTAASNYTWTVYSASGCASANKIADVAFTTSVSGAGLTLSATTVALTEGAAAGTYTVRLAAQPASDVTVTVSSGDSGAVTASPATLTFTRTGTKIWSTAQTVTLTPVDDTDTTDESVTITHTAAGGGYNGRSATLTATVSDEAILAVSGISDTGATLTISNHGGVAWWYKDTSGITSCTSVGAGTTTASPTWPGALNNFTYKAYSAANCGSDDDLASVTFGTIQLDPQMSFYVEGESGSLRVTLPAVLLGSANVTVTLTNPDTTALTLDQTTCTFVPQGPRTCPVSVTTLQDADYAKETVAISGTASGGGGLYSGSIGSATVTINDDDGIVPSMSTVRLTEGGGTGTFTVKLAGAPTDDVTMTVTSWDTGAVTRSPASLTFTTDNWNTPQTVTLTPVDDGDSNHESVTIRLIASGGGYGARTSVTAKVSDDEGAQLTASAVTSTTATLTLTNHTPSTWWYKKTLPTPAGNCTSGPSDKSLELSNLTASTNYTYKAYNASSCADANEIAEQSFSTSAAAPELAASNVKETTATLTISNHTGDWYYKYTVPATPAGSCSSVVAGGTATASLTGLTGGTAYTYKAYSNNTCTTEITSASTDAEFSTVGLTAGSLTQTGATLTLANWSAAWWHNKTAGPGSASCTSVAANTTTASLTGLTINSNYTWTVYSASGCASANKIADVDFSTSAVSLAASAVTETTATLTLTGHTAAWWYQGDQSGASCTAVAANTTTASLTGLTGGTDYTYKAYSENTCATELTTASSDAEFSTVGLTANPVAQTTATLTLSNWTAAWWHNKTTGPGSASCTSVAANTTTASLSGLTVNSNYTWTVYSASGCASANKIADVDFSTSAVSLAASAVTETTATLTLTGTTAAWWYQGDQSGASCTAVAANTTTASLTGLTGGTDYTYKAYSENTCATELTTASSDAEFSTVGLTAGSLTQTGATLTLSNWTAAWWFKKTAGAGGSLSCTPVSANTTTQSIGFLTIGTDYTYTVYSASGCASANKIADVDFTTAAATLAASAVTETTATLTISGTTAAWWYKRTAPTGDTTCHSVNANDATDDLTGLTGGTAYTYKAYSNSTCATEITNDSTDAEFSTVGLTAGSLTQTGATLTLANWSAAWWHNKTAGPGSASCTSVAANTTTASLTGLTINSNYTWAVYSASGCASANKIADVAFSTSTATLAASAVKETTATLTLSNHTAAWWYQGDQGGASCTAVAANTTTASLTGLTGGTAYTYKAYSENTCATEITSASTDAEFSTVGLTANPVAQTTATLTLANWSAAWWHNKTTGPGSTSCTAVAANTTTASLTGLTVNSSYIWAVYSASGCASANKIADVAFSTSAVSLAASAVTETTATLTISGHTAAWWYQRIAPTGDTTCHSVAANTATASLSSLTGGTAYTYKAYSENTCATELTTDSTDAEFTTSLTVPKMATPTLTGGAKQISLSWSHPVGVSGLQAYRVRYREKGQSTWTYADAKADSGEQNFAPHLTSATLPAHETFTMKDATTYQVQIRGGKWSDGYGGWGAWSDTAEAATDPPAPYFTYWNIEWTGAQIKLHNYTSSWYYKQTAPGTGNCTAASDHTDGTTTETLTGLQQETPYTYKAYSDVACSDDNLIATASFTTLPGKVEKVKVESRDQALAVSWEARNHVLHYWVEWKSGNQNYDPSRRQVVTSNSTTIGSLVNGTSYSVRVAAFTSHSGGGFYSDGVTGTPVAAPALSADSIEATTATLTLSNHSAAWYYKYTSPSGGQCSSEVTAGTTTASLTNLTQGTTYTFTAYSDSSCATELATAPDFITRPGQVTGVSAAAGDRSLSVSWSAVTGAASYKVQWKSGTQEYGSSRQATPTGTTHTIPSLTSDTQYTLRVAAVNASGDGAWSADATGTPSGPTLAASNIQVTTATLTISEHSNAAWYYKYTVPATPAGSCSSVVASGTTTASLTGLTQGTTYTFAAYSDSTCTAANLLATASSFLTKPGQVTGVGVNALSGKLEVTWSDMERADSYKVQWKCGTQEYDSSRQASTTGGSTNKYTISNLTNNTTCTVRVAAVNASGDGAWSAEGTGMPTAVTLSAGSVTTTTATLTITNHTGNWHYKYTSPAGGQCSAAQTGASAGVTNLTPNTSYTFKAYSDSTCSTLLSTAAAFTTQAVKVTGVLVNALNTGLRVSWNAVEGAASYKVQWKSENQNYGSSRQDTATGTQHSITGLDNNTTYTVRVAAVIGGSDNAWSDDATGAPNSVYLSAGAVTRTTATLTLGGRTGNWWYTKDGSTTPPCLNTGISGATLSLTGLDAGTEYTIRAFSNSNCGPPTTAYLTEVTFRTVAAVALSASSVEATSATLTIANHTGNWYYKANAAPDASCSSTAVSATSVNLSGLSTNTNYTYNAYSDSGCTAANLLATASSFLTKPGKPTTPAAATSVGSGKLTITASVTGSGTLSKWQYQQKGGGNYGDWQDISSTSTSLSHTVSGLTNGTDYQFKVRAVNATGNGATSDASTAARPEAVTLGVTSKIATAATLTLGGYTGNWWWTKDEESTCSNTGISGTTLSLSNLTKNTSYTINAWPDNSCGPTSIRLAQVTFTTPASDATLAASSVEAATATLTINDYMGDWYYKADAAPHASCSSAVTTTSVGLSDLAGNTSYTYKAYSDSGCNTELATASAFLTKPAKPGKPTATTNVGSGKIRLASSIIGGNGALIRWEYTIDDGANWSNIDDTDNTLDQVVSDLTNGTDYTFKVRAVNATGTGPSSDASDAATPVSVETLRGGGGSANRAPGFGSRTIADQTWIQGLVIEPLVLPAAQGGGGTLTYKLEPALPPGLFWNKFTRTLSGAPEAPLETTRYTYTAVTQADYEVASLTFLLTVEPAGEPDRRPAFSEDQRVVGNGKLAGHVPPDAQRGSGGATMNANTLVRSSAPGTGNASPAASAMMPSSASGPGGAAMADLGYVQNAANEPLTLPAATGGDGTLSYTLDPALPQGMRFDTAMRMLSGTPTTSMAATRYTYTATDEDGDTATLTFTLAVAADLLPAFGAGATLPDLSYEQGTLIAPMTLPAATGGDGPLSYALAPALPQGLNFDATTRILSGTPETRMTAERYTYTVTDADGDTAQLSFFLAAVPSAQARAEEAVLVDGLASQGRAVLGGARRALDGRFRDADQSVDLSVLRANWSDWQDRLTAAAKGTHYGAPGATGDHPGAAGGGVLGMAGADAAGFGLTGARGRTSSMPPHDVNGGPPPAASGDMSVNSAAGAGIDVVGSVTGADTGASALALPGVFGLSGLSGTCGTMALEETPWPDASDSRVDNGWDDGACNGAASVRLSDWLWGRRYALRLNGMFGNGDDDEARSGPDWTLWSAGDQHRVEGAPGQNRYETDWRSMHLGLDARFNSDWLAGVVVSRGWGETGYGYEAQGISGAGGTGYGYESSGLSGTGELSTDIWTALPYLHGRLGGFEVWGLAGGGWGEIRATRSEGDGIKEDSNLNLWLGAVGASKPLLGLGAMSLSFVADAGMTYLTTEKGEGTLDGLEATTQQVRLGLAGEYEASLFDGQAELTPFWQLSGRYDGGDGLAGAGLEAQAGLRYRSERLSLVAQGHWLGMHSETGYKEYGASMEARVSPLAHGRGLTLALSPRWGADGALSGAASGMGTANSAAGIGAMWDTDIVRRAAIANTQAVNDDTAHVWSVDAEVGYGLWLPYQLGLLTPFSEMRLAGGHEQRQRLGLRLDAAGAQGLQLELTGFRASTYLETDTGVNLNATLSY